MSKRHLYVCVSRHTKCLIETAAFRKDRHIQQAALVLVKLFHVQKKMVLAKYDTGT